MLNSTKFRDYEILNVFTNDDYSNNELVDVTTKLLKPFDDSVEATADAIDNAIKYGFCHIVKAENEIIGICIVVNFRLNGFIPTYHMAYLGVDPNYQRKGIARRLVEIALEEAKGEMSIHVDLDNAAAKKLYEGFGFKHLYNRYLIGRDH